MSPPREAGRLSRLFRWLLPGDMGAEVCDELDRQQLERRAQLGAAVARLWLAAHLLLPQTWVLALMLRRREREPRRKRCGLGVSWLDVKLGLRMLRLNPGLTIVAIFALSIGIPASLIPIHGMDAMGAPLPFDEADQTIGARMASEYPDTHQRLRPEIMATDAFECEPAEHRRGECESPS